MEIFDDLRFRRVYRLNKDFVLIEINLLQQP